jgi:hypothetical protein
LGTDITRQTPGRGSPFGERAATPLVERWRADAANSWSVPSREHRGCARRARSRALASRRETACGVVAGPLFVSAFTAIGRRRAGYDWQRQAVSSLARGRQGWAQRANFMLAGGLYCLAAHGLTRSANPAVAPPVVPALMFGAGVGLIGSGLFVTDPVAGFRPSTGDPHGDDGARPSGPSTRAGQLHNLCAIPVFAGIPLAALISAGSAARRGEYRWAAYSAGSAIAMARSTVLFGRAFGGVPRLAGRGGLFQRISIATGFGWLSALSLGALTSHAA